MKTTKKTASRRVYVKTIAGEKLELKKDRLTQLATEDRFNSRLNCYVTFAAIRKAVVGTFGLRVSFTTHRLPEYQYVDVRFNPALGELGCCTFDEKTFNKIMKAAKSYIRFGQPVAPVV